jgi:two-component system, LuxR family, response regulator FixJ
MIYLIDDDKSVRRGLEMFLKSARFDYTPIESPDDFLAIYKPGHEDLIILDLTLNGKAGCDLLEHFEEKGISIPVIVVSSVDEPHRREICRKYGVKAFMRKPVDGEALIDIINYSLAK